VEESSDAELHLFEIVRVGDVAIERVRDHRIAARHPGEVFGAIAIAERHPPEHRRPGCRDQDDRLLGARRRCPCQRSIDPERHRLTVSNELDVTKPGIGAEHACRIGLHLYGSRARS
jgi:hypothetical protein